MKTNNYIKFIFAVLLFGYHLFLPKSVSALACNSSNPCPENYTCIGSPDGSCEQIGCFSNVICGECQECRGDICFPKANCGGGGGGGGGGGSCVPGVNCPTGWTTAWNQPYYSDYCDQSSTPTCSIGSAQSYGECCTVGCARRIVTTYRCCAPGTTDTCVIENTGTTYVREREWNTREMCDEPFDVFVGYEIGRVKTILKKLCNGEWVYNEKKDRDECNGELYDYTVYYYNTTCQDYIKTCSCTPNCTTSAPSVPTLVSPTNGSTISNTGSVTLTWDDSTQDWGTSCTTGTNEYIVRIGTSTSTLAQLGTVDQGSNSIPFNDISAGQTYHWMVRASNGSETTDSPVWTFTVNDGPWWQVENGDVTTNSNISSDVPTGQLFSMAGLGGFPGVPVFGGTFNLSSSPSLISTNSWNSNTTTSQPRLFNYNYFKNLIPDEVVQNITTATDTSLRSTGFEHDGYEWFRSNSSLTIESDIDFGSRKVILFVENGDLNISGTINLTDGIGFFGAFVEGSIVVDSSVAGSPAIEGFFETDSGFASGAGDEQLHVRGSVVSYGTVNLQRDITTNGTTPAELFEFAPDLLFNFPSKLGFRRSRWSEIAP